MASSGLLPTAAPNGHAFPLAQPRSALPPIFRRLHKFHQMDFEVAAWQLTYLCISPRRVYKNVYFHKQTKNTWARDDPAILVLIAASILVTAALWALVYTLPPAAALRLALTLLLRDFLLSSLAAATLLYLLANALLLAPPAAHAAAAAARVEWAYALDVALNAFFPAFLALGPAQLLLVAVVTRDNWVCLWVGNTLYLVAASQYSYGVFLGLNALPFLVRTELLLFPLLPLFGAYLVSLLGFNVAKTVLGAYFG